MKTKRYPNMMPPEGSFMWRFLTDRRLHMWITLVGFLPFNINNATRSVVIIVWG